MLMLFDASLDGIEDSGNDVSQAMGMDNLAAADWFEPFDPQEAVSPAAASATPDSKRHTRRR